MTPDCHHKKGHQGSLAQEAIEAALKALAARRANRGRYEGSQGRGAVLSGHGTKLQSYGGTSKSSILNQSTGSFTDFP